MFSQISQNSSENTKTRFWDRCLLVNSVKFLITLYLKNPSDVCFCIKTRSVYSPTTTFRLYKNDVTHILWLSIIFDSIYKLGTKVSLICKTLGKKPNFNPVNYLGWNFSCENSYQLNTVRYFFLKKLSCRCSSRL